MRQIFASIAIFFMSPLGALSVSTPVTLSLSESPSQPCVALNEKGEAVVLWTSNDLEEISMVEVSTCNSTKEWSSPSILGKRHSHEGNPQLVLDSDGTVFSVWKGAAYGNPFFQWVKKEKNGSLSSSMIEIQDPTINRDCYLDKDGNLSLLDTNQDIPKIVTYEHQTQKKISREIPRNSVHRVMTPQEKEFVVFISESKGYFWNSYSVKGVWIEEASEPVTIIDLFRGNQYQFYPVAVNDNGNIGVIWAKKNSPMDWIVATVYVDGKWSESVPLIQRNGVQNIQSEIDAEGNFLVVWSKIENNEQGLFAAYKPKEQDWLSPVLLFNSNLSRFEISQSKGHFVVMWDKIVKPNAAVHSAVFSTATLNWSFQQLSPGEVPCANANMAFNEYGYGVIAWEAIINGTRYIQAAELSLQ